MARISFKCFVLYGKSLTSKEMLCNALSTFFFLLAVDTCSIKIKGPFTKSYPGKCLPAKFNTITYLPSKILVYQNDIMCNNLPGKRLPW